MAQWLSWLECRPVTPEVEGSSPFWVVNGIIAQLGEHLPYKQGVTGSSPVGPIYQKQKDRTAMQFYPNIYGWVPEWPKGADCKSVVDDFEGSNPSPSTSLALDRKV